MHKVKRLNCVPEDELTGIIGSKRGANRIVLDTALPRILRRYGRFEARLTPTALETHTAATWSTAEETALLHCYTTEVAALTELKRLIRGAQPKSVRSICPYCGIGGPHQFDHYLPKSRFPELAVHAYNLIPCCGPCNGLKSETWLVTGSRAFINFYIDSLPTSAVVHTEISWRTYRGEQLPTISFQLVRPAGFRRDRFVLIESHFERLNLLERYREEASTVFDEFRDNAMTRDATSVTRLRRFLQHYIDKRTVTLGPLNWKLSLYQALLAHRPFLESCIA
jgi:hypothetical protein